MKDILAVIFVATGLFLWYGILYGGVLPIILPLVWGVLCTILVYGLTNTNWIVLKPLRKSRKSSNRLLLESMLS